MALLQEEQEVGTGGANPAFTLEAPSLRIDTDRAEVALHVGTAVQARESTVPSFYSNAWVEGLAVRALYRWGLFSSDPARPARMEATSCIHLLPSQEESLVRHPNAVSGALRAPTKRDISAALQWAPCAGSAIRVTGDFVLSLWEWDARLVADGEVQFLKSGKSSLLPAGAPDVSHTLSEDREVHLFVHDGVLTVPALTGGMPLLYSGPRTRLAAPVLLAQGATGSLDVAGQAVALSGSTVSLAGQAEAIVSGTGVGSPLQAGFTGAPSSLVVDGRAVTLPGGGEAAAPWAWLLLGAVLVPAAAVPTALAVRSRQRRGDPHLLVEEAYDFLGAHRATQALRKARRAVRLDASDPEAHFTLGCAHAAAGNWKRALAAHEAAEVRLRGHARKGSPDEGPLRAENAFEAARCCMRLALQDPALSQPYQAQARGWLRLAVQCQDVYLEEACGDPFLAGLVEAKGQRAWWAEP